MKAILLQNGANIEIYGHDLDDQTAATLMSSFTTQGRKAFLVDQSKHHGGAARDCERCLSSVRELTGGKGSEPAYTGVDELRHMVGAPLSGGIGMVSHSDEKNLRKTGPSGANLKAVVPVLILIVLAAIAFFAARGAGGPAMQRFLAASIKTATLTVTPTLKPTDTPIPPATSTPSSPTATLAQPTPTLAPSLTPTTGCRDVSTITLNDLDQTMCVQGKILKLDQRSNGFYITFSSQKGAFYMVSYERAFPMAKAKACIQVTGKITKIGSSPVMLLDYKTEMTLCP